MAKKTRKRTPPPEPAASTLPTGWERTRLPIADLVPYPSQEHFFGGTTSPEDDEALRRDLAHNGQRDPVHVLPGPNKAELPANTVLDGMRRMRLQAENGQESVDGILRYDLKNASRAEVEKVFLSFNTERRQLQSLDRARIALRLYELERGREPGSLRGDEERAARDRVGATVGMSGRHLQRLFRILLTPLPVQRAVREGRLTMILGERVEQLKRPKQQEIAKRIEAGEDPNAVVGGYLPAGKSRLRATDLFLKAVKDLDRMVANLGDGASSRIHWKSAQQHTPSLLAARELLDRLIEHGEAEPEDDSWKKLAETVARLPDLSQ